MYVCLCHGFTDRDVRRVVSAGGSTVGEIYQALGYTPRCGKCVPEVRDMVKGDAGNDAGRP